MSHIPAITRIRGIEKATSSLLRVMSYLRLTISRVIHNVTSRCLPHVMRYQLTISRVIHKATSRCLPHVMRYLLTISRVIHKATSRFLPHVMQDLRLAFISGPKLLFTSRISGKCAAIMTMMCTPSLFCCFILTIPGLIFQSPQQNAYFYFSKVLDEDPARWIVLLLAATCTLMSLAIPATMPESNTL